MPTLHRGNFFTYTFNFGRVPEPDWLRNMKADGTIQTGTLDLGGGEFTNLRTHIIWEGTDVRLDTLATQFGDAAFKGSAKVHLAGRQPRYEVTGKLAGFAWRGGTIGAEGTLTTSGTGTALLSNIHAQGTFDGRNIELSGADVYDSATGSFTWAWDARSPKLKLPQLVMKSGDETYLGSAEMADDGQLVMKVNDGTRRIPAPVALKPSAQ